MQRTFAIFSFCALTALSGHAAMLLGLGADADYYAPTLSGHFATAHTDTLFADKTEGTYQMSAFVEHPLPLVPNLRIDMTPDLAADASGNRVTLRQYDITPYYEVVDSIVDLDVGVTFKVIDGTVTGSGGGDSVKTTVPMGYVGVGMTIPMSGIRLQGDVKYVGFDGDYLTDAKAKIAAKMGGGLELQAGYRYEQLKLTNRSGITADLEIKGPFAGAGFNF